MGARVAPLITALLLNSAAAAQELPSDVEVSSITKGGVTEGCSVQYTAAAQDHIYKAGGVVGISGSLAWMLHPKMGIAGMMKLVAADFSTTGPSTLNPFPVTHGFVRINEQVFQVEQRYECDQPAGFCGAIGLDKAMKSYEAYAIGGEEIAFGFNRTKEGMDVTVTVPTLNPTQSSKLNTCMLAVIDEAKRRSQKKSP